MPDVLDKEEVRGESILSKNEKDVIEQIEDSMKKMDLTNSTKLDNFRFDYHKALEKLPYVNIRKGRPWSIDKNSEEVEIGGIFDSFRLKFPD
mgnify:FL=1